jgi:hypothetical protein
MPKRLLTKVYAKDDDNEYGPNYALIEMTGVNDLKHLTEKVTATLALAQRFIGDATTSRTGLLYSTEWWLSALPFEVTWLAYDAVTLDDDSEPDWLTESDSTGYVVPPEDWQPRLGEETTHGHQNEDTWVDCVTVKVFPDRNLRIEGNVKDSALEFGTCEFPASAFED